MTKGNFVIPGEERSPSATETRKPAQDSAQPPRILRAFGTLYVGFRIRCALNVAPSDAHMASCASRSRSGMTNNGMAQPSRRIGFPATPPRPFSERQERSQPLKRQEQVTTALRQRQVPPVVASRQ